MGSFRDDPQYNVMKYLVFGIISVIYFQIYKLLFLKPIAFLFIWSSHFTVFHRPIENPSLTRSLIQHGHGGRIESSEAPAEA